ncbi:MAG: hypothetical protein GEU96_22940, partial [Propionibacteriales bacterium]|nr:hypothetical protein [Propionibacteriales bacterium]
MPAFDGTPAAAKPLRSFDVPRHPFLAPNERNSMHNDAYATDAYATRGPLGRDMEVSSAWYGALRECATVTFDRRDRLVAMCGGLEGGQLRLIDPDTLDVLASHQMPPRRVREGKTPLNDVCIGAYFYLDNNDDAVAATSDQRIMVVGQRNGPEFTLRRSYDLSAELSDQDCLLALSPDWAGRVWFVTEQAVVGTLDRDTGSVRTVGIPGEAIVNSFAADETGGVFVVTDHALYRMDARPDGTPEITWREPYDRGSRVKPGQLSRGSGATPTLLGRDLVAITDNAEPRMHVLVYRRGTDVRGDRLVCRVPVFEAGQSATENSMVAAGRSLIVENNYGYTGPASTMSGKTTAPGIARVVVGDHGCRLAWTSDEIAPTSVPKVSLGNGLLYVYGKPANDYDPWYFTAIDVRTGRTAWRRLTGTGP